MKPAQSSDGTKNCEASHPPRPPLLILPLAVLLVVVLAGCRPWIRIAQTGYTTSILLNANQTVGQTLVAQNDGLEGIQLYLAPQTAGDGIIQLSLRSGPGSTKNLATARLPVQTVDEPGYYTFSFPFQTGSNQQYYYAFLRIRGTGELQVYAAPGNSYLNGSAYAAHEPLDAQLAFRLAYQPGRAILGLAEELLRWAGILAAAGFVFLLPGWALLSLLLPSWRERTWLEKVGLASGLGIALPPLLLLWTDLVGIHLGRWYAWLLPAAAALALLWQNRRFFSRRQEGQTPRFAIRSWIANLTTQPKQPAGFHILLLAILALLILTRFWPIRAIEGPMWGDSYQHAVITQLIVDHGGLFDSWEPYTDLRTFTYHFGFHSAASLLTWLTGASPLRSVLWTGQILNILAVLALYPLARKVGGSPWAGAGALVIAGLLSPMPMFYTNWGRYTQLAGQVILPIAVFFTWTALEGERRDWRTASLAAIALGGLALTHLRVLPMAVIFLAAFFPVCVRKNTLRNALFHTLVMGAGSVLLSSPWLLHLFAGKIVQLLSWHFSVPTQQAASFLEEYNQIGSLLAYLPAAVWGSFFVAAALGLWRREKRVALVSLWWLLLLLLTNPQWLGLPGAGSISNFTLFLAAYIPAALLIGAAFGWLVELAGIWGSRRWAVRFWRTTAGLLLLAVALWGAPVRIRDIQPHQYAMLTRPDVRAAAWIRKNIPQEGRFFVNTFLAFGGGSSAGTDSGWWLPLLAARQTTLPPMNYSFEQGARPDFQQWINELTAVFQAKGVDHPDFLAMLRDRQVNYIYIGQRQGQVGNAGTPVLEAEVLLSSPNYVPVYHQDRVYIFAVRAQTVEHSVFDK